MPSVFSSAYLPPVSYIASILNSNAPVIEKHEHYIKQTYRNRALIYSPQGLHPLIIPVEHKDLYKKPIHEVKISYDAPWQKIHWRTLTSSYRNSPYFEFFEDDLAPFYQNKFETLFEFNTELLKKIFLMLGLNIEIRYTEEYMSRELVVGSEDAPHQLTTTNSLLDLRNYFNPHERSNLPSYYQVFSERNEFISDLSIVDLLFNKGKDSISYLKDIAN